MSFFDTISNPAYRMKVLKLFPEEFSKGSILYKTNKLNNVDDNASLLSTSSNGWYLLDPENTVKFSLKRNE
jgi:hypothetical protein